MNRETPVTLGPMRLLTEEDAAPTPRGSKGTKPQNVKRITQRHHRLARCLAEGMSNTEAAIECGLDPARVCVLRQDPSVAELIRHYSQRVQEQYELLHQKLADVAGTAADELMHRLEHDPDAFDVNELISVLKTGADRTGYGPQAKTETNITYNLADRLDAARRRRLAHVEDAEIVDE